MVENIANGRRRNSSLFLPGACWNISVACCKVELSILGGPTNIILFSRHAWMVLIAFGSIAHERISALSGWCCGGSIFFFWYLPSLEVHFAKQDSTIPHIQSCTGVGNRTILYMRHYFCLHRAIPGPFLWSPFLWSSD